VLKVSRAALVAAGLLLACLPLLLQPPRGGYGDSLVLAPLYVNYTTDDDAEFSRQAQALKANIGAGPDVQLGFASFLRMTYPVGPSGMEGFNPMLTTVEAIVDRAEKNQIVTHISIISGFFHDTNNLRAPAVLQDVRNAQWFSDGWIAEPDRLVDAATVPSTVWITPSRYARRLRSQMEEGARILGSSIAAQMTRHPETLVSVSGDAEVEFSYERNIEGGERRVARSTPVYADYSPFMVEEFREWLRTSRYNGDLTPATDENHDGRIFNRDFKQSFITWKLRYYDASGPIPFATYLAFKEKLPSQGVFFIEDGFDAPRQEKPGDVFWETWTRFRKQVIANYVRDFATWVTTSPDPVSLSTIPADRFYSHQIPADFLFGDPNNIRLKTSASYAETAALGALGSTGVTVFNTYDGKIHKKTGTDSLFRKLSTSNWGIFEYNPSVPIRSAQEPTADVEYYLRELRNLARFRPRILVPFAWTNEPHLNSYRIQGRAFETALKRFVASRQ
jgi:hypothetical protein